jgi:hypothetical protein
MGEQYNVPVYYTIVYSHILNQVFAALSLRAKD